MTTSDENTPNLYPARENNDLSTYAHRQLIGGIGLVLPALLWLIAGLRPTEGLHRWELLSSVSAYYYTGAVSAFVGMLIALALFLFSYHGYKNDYRWRDRLAAIIAGAASAMVAFFPAGAPSNLSVPSWWTPLTGTIHSISAVALFGAFIFFSLFQFPKSKVKRPESLTRDKRLRNWIYVSCGVGMVVCMLWAGSALLTGASIFWPEALALELFALSWLVKGRADWTAVAAARRTLHYGSHPGQLVSDVKNAFRAGVVQS